MPKLFLKRFYQKVKVFGMIFRDDREKFTAALTELDITPKYRESVILSLSAEDYIEGPKEDTLKRLGEMWVAGKDVKN